MTSMSAPLLSGRELECMLAFHCAPVMAGVKPANIISIKKTQLDSLRRGLGRVARPLGGKGLYFFRLAQCKHRVLLAVYHRERLQRHLERPTSAALLARYGYPPGDTVGGLLRRLAERIRTAQGFPHEIGVFLGYPLSDVERFIQNKGQNYRLCGYWKVYGDVEEAKRIFSVYDNARLHFCRKVADGEEIYNITYGGTAI